MKSKKIRLFGAAAVCAVCFTIVPSVNTQCCVSLYTYSAVPRWSEFRPGGDRGKLSVARIYCVDGDLSVPQGACPGAGGAFSPSGVLRRVCGSCPV